jgi:hypothetical protein
MIRVPAYLLFVGGAAIVVVIGTLIYARYKNHVLLNRFLVGYAGGLAGTAVIHLFLAAGIALRLTPNVIYALGNLSLGRGMQLTPSTSALAMGLVYHYLLDGAAWGAAYALLVGKARWWYGVFFGIGVWAALVISPVFSALNFPKTAHELGPLLILMLLIAHMFYGGVIGYIVYRFVYPEVGVEGAKAVRPAYG